MANVQLILTAESPASWRELHPVLTYYAEEADIRLDAPDMQPARDDLGSIVGVRLKVPGVNVERLHDIVTKAGLRGLAINIRPIPNNPAEVEIQSKLYRGGDTSMKPAEPTDRVRPSSHPQYRENNHAETLKEAGRRARVDGDGFPISK